MKAYVDQIICPICKDLIENPVSCPFCGNSFCFDCVKLQKKKKDECPICGKCRKDGFELNTNEGLNQILNSIVKICDFCHKKIKINEEDKHKKNCKIYKCNYCEGNFYDEKSFYNHFFKDEIHKDILVFSFDKKKMNEKMPKSLEENIEKIKDIRKKTEHLEKILNEAIKNEDKKKGKIYEDSKEIHPYLNLVQINKKQQDNLFNVNDEYSQLKNNIEPPPGVTLNQFMDLFYCGCQTNFPCEYNICFPGSFLCPSCLRLNQRYHGLKRHYLINYAGRVSRCIKGKFQCNCEYVKISQSQGNTFYNRNNCNNNSLCDACYDLNNREILLQYLPEGYLYKVLNN